MLDIATKWGKCYDKWEAFDLQNRASGITKQGKYYRMAQFS